MVQHTVATGVKRIRYYGVQATKTFAKVKVMIHTAVAKVEGVVKGAVQIITRFTSRQRYKQSTGRNFLSCPFCRGERGDGVSGTRPMGASMPRGEVIKRGTYASTAQRAGP